MEKNWYGKNSSLALEGHGLVPRAINTFIFIKQRHFIVKLIRLCPDWITPNRVTWFRLLTTIPVVYLILTERWWSALAISIISLILDFVDGALAEAENLKTKFGAILDPLVDKVFVIAIAAALAPSVQWYWQATILTIILIEVSIGGIRLAALTERGDKAKNVIVAKWSGKLKMVCESIGFVTMLLGLATAVPLLIFAGGIVLEASTPCGMISLVTKIFE